MNELVRARQLFAVRDAIAAHLGEEGARMLGIQVADCAGLDGIEVTVPFAGFFISRSALRDSPAWREELGKVLDQLVDRPA